VEIEITTLSDVLFMGSINDLAFIIANKLIVLIEHVRYEVARLTPICRCGCSCTSPACTRK
jgi:hypothetical protein